MANSTDYAIPPYGSSGATLLTWALDAVAQGESWLKAQKPTQEWDAVTDMLGSQYGGALPPAGLSNTGYNRGRHIARELVATLANFRHAGEVTPTVQDAPEFFDRAHLLTDLDENWERKTFAHEEIRRGLQYGIGKGTGYWYEDWDSGFHGPGRGDIRLKAIDPADVTFVQLPKDGDIQRAYVVLIRFELPLGLAQRLYANNPAFAASLRADRDAPGWVQKGLQRVQQFISPMLRVGGSAAKQGTSFPTVDVWHAYTLDSSINDRGTPMRLGAYRTNWSYIVPALGDPIPLGVTNPSTGHPATRAATEEDCLLFPLRRLSIFSRTAIAYDGSSPWWHGDVPLARVRFNDWAWEALGASQVGDVATMQDGVIALMRAVEDAAAAQLDPMVLYDDSKVDKAWAEAINPRKAGVRAAADLTGGSPIEFPLNAAQYTLASWIYQQGGWITQQEDRMDYLTSVRDLTAIAKAKQIPGADTLEKLMEMAGPIVQDMVRALDQPLTQLGTWRISYFLQFYTKARMLRIADADGAELLDQPDYVPDKLEEQQRAAAALRRATGGTRDVKFDPAALLPITTGQSIEDRTTALRVMVSDYEYQTTESGINEIHRMTTKLFYLQLIKLGFPLSPWTFAKIASIPNFGPPPRGTNTEMERWIAWQHMQAELQGEIAGQAAADAGAVPGTGAPATPAAGGSGGGPPGRPNSFAKPPKIEQKDGGTRSTVTTS